MKGNDETGLDRRYEFMVRVGEAIFRERVRRGLTQDDVVVRVNEESGLGIGARTLRRIEGGEHFGLVSGLAILDALGLELAAQRKT